MAENNFSALLQLPVNELTNPQAITVLGRLLKNKDLIKPEHLDLAIKNHQFPIAIQFLEAGIKPNNIVESILEVLNSSSSIGTDFYVFLLFSICNNIDLSSIFDHLDSINSKYETVYLIMALNSFITNQNLNIDFNSLKQPFNLISSDVPFYEIVKYTFNDRINNFLSKVSGDLQNAQDSLNSSIIVNTLDKLNQKFKESVHSFTSAKSKIEQFQKNFDENTAAIESFLTSDVLKNIKVFRLAIIQINSTCQQINKLNKDVSFISTNIIDKFLSNPTVENAQLLIEFIKNIGHSFAHNANYVFNFSTSSNSFLLLSYMVSILFQFCNNNNLQESIIENVQKLKEKISDMTNNIINDLPSYQNMMQIISTDNSFKSPDHPLYKSVRYFSNILLLALHYSECACLENKIRKEAAEVGRVSSFYPKSHSKVFSNIIKPSNTLTPDESLYEYIEGKISSLLSSLKFLNGMIRDTCYSQFEPEKKWPWFRIPGIEFPSTPEDVRKVLLLRGEISSLFSKYLSCSKFPTCKLCHRPAKVVCPKCRKLVLCNLCIKTTNKCPCENCDYEFQNS